MPGENVTLAVWVTKKVGNQGIVEHMPTRTTKDNAVVYLAA